MIDQPLRWLDEGSWEWRFPLAAAPRYLGEPGRVQDASKIAFDVAEVVRPRASLMMEIGDVLAQNRSPESPSHPLQCSSLVDAFRVELGSGNRAELDRDLVVRWPVAELSPVVSAFVEGSHALLTIVPPRREAKATSVARDLIVLLDTSGSMGGSPLDQARRVSMALIDGLLDSDSIELIEFSNAPRRFRAEAVRATKENKQAALAWLAALRAGGATEMRAGILEALQSIRPDGQRQIVLITDGLIGFETEIVEEILTRLPAGSRVHTVGVGSSVNRSLTGPAARAGKGIEVVIGLGEDPERAAERLRARTEAPLVVNVSLGGPGFVACAPEKVPDLYAGAPVLVSAKVRPEGGEIVVRGRTPSGLWEERVRVTSNDVPKGALSALFARESVEDAEMKLAAGGDKEAIDQKVEELGLTYAIATRLTSWVAVDKTPSVDPLLPTRREVVPQMLPHGMSVDGLGLRPCVAAAGPSGQKMRAMTMPLDRIAPPAMSRSRAMPPAPARASGGRAPEPPKKEMFESEFAREEKPRAAPAAPRAMPGAPMPPPPARPSPHAPEEDADDAAPERAIAPRRRPVPIVRGSFTGASQVLNPAKVVRRNGREITIEIRVEMEIDWDPASFDAIWFGGEKWAKGTVDLGRTTYAAKLRPGQVVRVVVLLDEEPDPNALVREIVFEKWAFAIV